MFLTRCTSVDPVNSESCSEVMKSFSFAQPLSCANVTDCIARDDRRLVVESLLCVSAFIPFSVSCVGDSALGHDRCVLGLKENSSKCHPHSCTYIVTSVLWFCVFLPISPFGHDLRMLVQVCLVVDLLLCRSLLVTLDTGTWLSG